jgi:glycosyltransferase involved in cell wall biosynthesis
MKTLSVILLNYNQAHWLPRSLRAHAEQADASIEILVVDDGSTDASVAVIEQLTRNYPSIRLLRHETNKGVLAAVHTGRAAATGKYLLFAAADDLVLPGLYRTAIAMLDARPEAALFCTGTALIDTDDNILGFRPVTPPRDTAGYMTPDDVRRGLRHTDNWFIGSSVVYRRAPLQALGYFDDALGSLADGLANRLLALQHGFCFEPRVLSAWRRYAESFSGRVAMSFAASETSLAAAGRYIAAHYPADVRDEYAALFDKRYRYNLARLRLAWGGAPPDPHELTRFLRLGRLDGAVLAALAHVPVLGTKLVLVWITLRLRPFAYSALAVAWWRRITAARTTRAEVQRLLREEPADAALQADAVRAHV